MSCYPHDISYVNITIMLAVIEWDIVGITYLSIPTRSYEHNINDINVTITIHITFNTPSEWTTDKPICVASVVAIENLIVAPILMIRIVLRPVLTKSWMHRSTFLNMGIGYGNKVWIAREIWIIFI